MNDIMTAALEFGATSPSISPADKHISTQRLDFRRITPYDMEAIMPYLKRDKGRTTDFSYGGLLMWVDVFHYESAIVHDTLFVKGRLENNLDIPAYSLPLGSLPIAQSVTLLRRHSRENELPLMFSAIPEYALSQFMELNPRRITLLDGWGDYLYEAEKLATLSGKKMAKKRNHVNQYVNMYGADTFEPIDTANIGDVIAFMSRLKALSPDYGLSPMAIAERNAAEKTLHIMAQGGLKYEGGLLRIDGRVVAYTIGDTKGDTLYIHIEKADREIAGAYEAINKYFAAYMLERYPHIAYINREDDAGDAGLRRAKESYHPVSVLKKYNVIF